MAPVVSSLLFVIVFGLSLGGRIRQVSGFEYQVFILPGLVAMAMFMAAYMNNSSSVFQARNDRYIDDILAAPMMPWQVDVGLTVGGVFRALMIGAALTAIGAPLLGVPIERPFALIVCRAGRDHAVRVAGGDRRHLRADLGPRVLSSPIS